MIIKRVVEETGVGKFELGTGGRKESWLRASLAALAVR
jgi:hypothetical protein